jgi:pyruvate-ferredoxin/flavodoxin oxidoreductase
MTYKNVYVASVSLGANYQQLINSLIEAESYDGPSIVICYSPCNEHGMSSYAATPIEQKKAVLSGY